MIQLTQTSDLLSLPPEERDVVCILGGRSGTSLVARLLNIMGVYLGPEKHLIPGDRTNERGYWEHAEFVAINDEILARHGVRWPQVTPLADGWEKDSNLDDLRDRAHNLIRTEFADAPLWGWKDPRTCVTLPFWQTVIPRMRCVLCFRNPVDTAASNAETLRRAVNPDHWMHVREKLYKTSVTNWLEFIHSMLQHTAGKPSIAVFYEDVMERTEIELRRLARFIDRPEAGTHPSVLTAAREFKSDGLRHHNTSVEQVLADPALPNVAKEVYLSLRTHVSREQQAYMAAEPASDSGITVQSGLRLGLNDQEDSRMLQHHVQRIIAERTPPDADVLVASHGDNELLIRDGRTMRHFPQDERGNYAGYHPADSAEAIDALRDAQARHSAGFLVIPRRQLWWLEHYRELRDHLQNDHRELYADEHCVLYELRLRNAPSAEASFGQHLT